MDPWEERHTELLVRLSSDPDVTRHIGAGVVWPRSQAETVSAAQQEHWRAHGFGWRGAVEKASGLTVGFIALNLAGIGTAGLDPSELEIGWWLDPGVWGRGLAAEGAAAVVAEAFENLAAPSVVARIQPKNAASTRVARSLGLTLDFTSTGRHGEPVAIYRLDRPPV